jgi:hypothetical protein
VLKVPFASATLAEGTLALLAAAPGGTRGGAWQCAPCDDGGGSGGGGDGGDGRATGLARDPSELVCAPRRGTRFRGGGGSESRATACLRALPPLLGRHFVGYSPKFVGFYAANLARQCAYACAVHALADYPAAQAAAALGVEAAALVASVWHGPYAELAGG